MRRGCESWLQVAGCSSWCRHVKLRVCRRVAHAKVRDKTKTAHREQAARTVGVKVKATGSKQHVQQATPATNNNLQHRNLQHRAACNTGQLAAQGDRLTATCCLHLTLETGCLVWARLGATAQQALPDRRTTSDACEDGCFRAGRHRSQKSRSRRKR